LDFNIFTQNFEVVEDEATKQSLYLTSGPHFELDYDLTIASAKKIYASMFPDEPFLPRAPDPDEIILGDPAEDNDEQTEVNDEQTEAEKEEIEGEVKEAAPTGSPESS